MEYSAPKRGLYTKMEQNAQVAAKRLWKIVRIVFCVLKTGTIKSKFMLDLNLMLKRSNKAITNLRRRSSFIDNVTITCRNTPPQKTLLPIYTNANAASKEEVVADAVKKVFELLGENDTKMVAGDSPFIAFPEVRQLRVTDSPFPLDDGGDQDHVVDKAAEEFIKKFYKNLKLQNKMANALDSPFVRV